MEENTMTLDIRAINEKIERESAFIDFAYNGNEQSNCWSKTHGRTIVNWTFRTRTYFIRRCSWISKNISD